MPRGMFTQCLCVLFKEPVTLDAVEAALAKFTVRARHEAADHWALGGPAISLAFLPEVNGHAMVDLVDHPWPDDMGDPQKETTIFGAWTMGQFGPMTSPGSLQRAMQQSWTWKEGRTVPGEHRAFARVRTSYVLGAGADAPVVPKDWDTAQELQFLTTVVEALLEVPGALCYFNPNGEVVRDLATLREQVEYAKSEGVLPIDVWSNVRVYPYDTDWVLMDTVGNGQLNDSAGGPSLEDLRDIEAVFRTKQYDYAEVDNLMRDLSLHLHAKGDIIKEGDTIDGPGNVPWRVTPADKSTAMPPRRVLRLVPVDGSEPPAQPA